MIIENQTKRLTQLIKVDVNRMIPLEKIHMWTKYIADEVFRSIPDGDHDLDVVITIDFSGKSGIRRNMKKMIMDSLEEELLR
ncbi:uncharacterized protein CELE_F58F12.2 [Caenorhabditis elegans]|uniref:Uncharacterized protein F58F12.2 n=1 Tax=Caenorhabditis elegans TaxID=6239 RepID=YRB2_CAEEL|nr:Uncharacterized protein CELE_F58F12.2 [Caenorhabditis elegans]Q09399.3 RecName: Full=Uncharacterized protein F58F12.2 [Caenorhabditis elegans]CCD72070.2 Uncharacterized protein CELE_F58F12.2 [Caenorhabditis elegans]